VGTLTGHWHQDAPGRVPAAERPQGLIVGYGTPGEGAYPTALAALVRALEPA
jgi:GntR family transcriptional regulator/MocR family aminotransferase